MVNEPRRMPIRRKEVELDGDYQGWHCTLRLNPPIRCFAQIASGQLSEMIAGLGEVILAWDFVDEDGNQLAAPSPATIGELPLDLMIAIANKFGEEVTRVPPRAGEANN